MSSSHPAIAQTYIVQTNGHSTANKANKLTHGSHSISVNCNTTKDISPIWKCLGHIRFLHECIQVNCDLAVYYIFSIQL